MKELDDILDELTGNVFVVVDFADLAGSHMTTISDKMSFDDAMYYWGKSRSGLDYVAHWKTPKIPITPTQVVGRQWMH